MSNNVIDLDDHRTLEALFKKRFKTTKFVVACYTDDDKTLGIYISDDLEDMELIYAIEGIKDYRNLTKGF